MTDSPLIETDDLAVHQVSQPLSRVGSTHPKWTERWYFNLHNTDGSLLGIFGGGHYPNTGVVETYACVLMDGSQFNVRARGRIDGTRHLDAGVGPSFSVEQPMRRWSWVVSGHVGCQLSFDSTNVPLLFEPFRAPARADDDPQDYDDVQHFVQPGTITGVVTVGDTVVELDRASSFRDRTWGVRSGRPKLHAWFVVHLDDGGYVTAIRQEHRDGTVMTSEMAFVDATGAIRRASVESHRFEFDPRTRILKGGAIRGIDGEGAPVSIGFQNTGEGIRLGGAGYDHDQGSERASQMVEDVWDLSSPEVIDRIGPGTIDSPIRAQLEFGDTRKQGTGISEFAVARTHHLYGHKIG